MANWLNRLVEDGRLGPLQREDLMRQRELFEQDRPTIEEQFQGQVVGYIADNLLAGRSIRDLLVQSSQYPDQQIYFEQVPYRTLTEPIRILGIQDER
jgi:hypothetical protein